MGLSRLKKTTNVHETDTHAEPVDNLAPSRGDWLTVCSRACDN